MPFLAQRYFFIPQDSKVIPGRAFALATTFPRRSFYFAPSRSIHFSSKPVDQDRLRRTAKNSLQKAINSLSSNSPKQTQELRKYAIQDDSISNKPFFIFKPIPSAFLQNRFVSTLPSTNPPNFDKRVNYYSTWAPSDLEAHQQQFQNPPEKNPPSSSCRNDHDDSLWKSVPRHD
jgi:hypothetical protein